MCSHVWAAQHGCNGLLSDAARITLAPSRLDDSSPSAGCCCGRPVGGTASGRVRTGGGGGPCARLAAAPGSWAAMGWGSVSRGRSAPPVGRLMLCSASLEPCTVWPLGISGRCCSGWLPAGSSEPPSGVRAAGVCSAAPAGTSLTRAASSGDTEPGSAAPAKGL